MKKILISFMLSIFLIFPAIADNVKIGFILGFTGPIESLAPVMAKSAEMAIDEVNKSGNFSAGKIDRGHAKVLLSLKNTKDIINQAKTISTQGISVSALNSSMRKKTKKSNTDPDIQSLIEELSNSFGHRVCISQKSKNKGQIEIIYTNTDEREIIIDKLKTFKGD